MGTAAAGLASGAGAGCLDRAVATAVSFLEAGFVELALAVAASGRAPVLAFDFTDGAGALASGSGSDPQPKETDKAKHEARLRNIRKRNSCMAWSLKAACARERIEGTAEG
jgi:hypothetical protein